MSIGAVSAPSASIANESGNVTSSKAAKGQSRSVASNHPNAPASFVQSSPRTAIDEKKASSGVKRAPTNEESNQAEAKKPKLTVVPSAFVWPELVRPSTRSKGLPNRGGRTCYRNSMVQALLHAPQFCRWLLESHRPCGPDSRCTICVFRRLCLTYWDNNQGIKQVSQRLVHLEANLRSTRAFRNWTWFQQQDAMEFYGHMIRVMAEGHPSSERHLETLLGHRSSIETECLSCHYVSPAPANELGYRLGVHLRAGGTLEQLLHRYTFAEEIIDHYRCEKCNAKQEKGAKQYTRLTQLPQILHVEFVRFSTANRGKRFSSSKITKFVKYSRYLDLSQFSSLKYGNKYRLFAVVLHQGNLKGGHYKCVAQSPSGQWEDFDDNVVTPVNATEAFRHEDDGWSAYSLMYGRVGVNQESRIKQRPLPEKAHGEQ